MDSSLLLASHQESKRAQAGQAQAQQSQEQQQQQESKQQQQEPKQQEQQNSTQSQSQASDSSSSSSSSRRLIRRRTVRRSYHHRALETESEPRLSNSLFATTTTTITSKSPLAADEQQQQSESRAATSGHSHRLDKSHSSSTTSSRIATSTHHHQHHHHQQQHQQHHQHHHHHHQQQQQQQKKSTQTQHQSSSTQRSSSSVSNSSSTSSSKSVSEEAQRKMISTSSNQAGNIDLNNKSEHHHHHQQPARSLFERRSRLSDASDLIERAESGKVEIEQNEESSVHRRELSSFNTSSRLHRHHHQSSSQANSASLACESSSMSSLSRSATKMMSSSSSSSRDARQQLETSTSTKSADLATASHHHFKSVFLSSAAAEAAAASSRKSLLQAPDSNLFASSDARSFARELGTDFAELESALSSTSFLVKQQQQQATRSSANFARISSSSGFGAARALGDSGLQHVRNLPLARIDSSAPAGLLRGEPEQYTNSLLSSPSPTNQTTTPTASNTDNNGIWQAQQEACQLSYNSGKILELLDKAQRHGPVSPTGSHASALAGNIGDGLANDEADHADSAASVNCRLQEKARCKAVMSEKIEKFDQKMSDWCKKLEECSDTQKTIDLMKIMTQMIEKAWSVPVCGDDLGFKLCNSLRQFGGLDIILGFIHEADANALISGSSDCDSARVLSATPLSLSFDQADGNKGTPQQPDPSNQQQNQRANSKQLRLNLAKVHEQLHEQQQQSDVPERQLEREASNSKSAPVVPTSSTCPSVDNDSDVHTSDLGLDSTSVESLSYFSASGPAQASAAVPTPPPSDESVASAERLQEGGKDAEKASKLAQSQELAATNQANASEQEAQEAEEEEEEEEEESEEMKRVRRDELVFLSAHLLSQCLTSENRDYIVKFGLDPVIKLACNFTTMKSGHSKRLLKRSALMRQSSTMKQRQKEQQSQSQAEPSNDSSTLTSGGESLEKQVEASLDGGEKAAMKQRQQLEASQEQRSDMHSAIGTEILQHLFKHSEETCWRMISLGALQAILYGCRSTHIETLRHCASALANLALYGGPDSQQMMIEQKAHVWLFPLAFNEDDNVQYYACLAIVVLAANQDIEADVLQSSTLDLVDPFVTSHEPRKFAESTTSHIHGQSAGWLKKLMPLLESKREEARNLACFHFAMEAYIKREQGQTELFKEIGSIELLRKAGSSPIAITSKFACQALRLIGEREPHKLSQQVPLWTCDDVCEWVNQIGFDKFQPAFRDSFVDGDLLLQLDEQQLRFDIGIENGLIRRRFLRELSNLKRIADYSSVDRGGLSSMLLNSSSILNNSLKTAHNGGQLVPNMILNCPTSSASSSANRNDARDFLQYIYPILKIGVTKDNIHLVDCEQLLADCKISNTLHRLKMAHAIHELQDRILLDAASSKRDSLGGEEQKTLDVFVSYRRSTGSQLASLLKVHLQLRGFSVFIDVERLEAGKFDNNLLDSIKTAKNFILVLSPNALDRCVGDHERKDWVHKEIVAAMDSKCNIIPIIDNFHWPDPEQLPEDMRSITTFNGIRWIHDYQDACVEKVERFIRGELSNSAGGLQTGAASGGAGSIISSVSAGSQTATGPGGTFPRLSSACNQSVTNSVSTPSIIATTPSLCPSQTPYSLQGKTHPPQAADHHSYTPGDASHHPLDSAYTNNLYLQQNLRIGNSNNNVRLQ